LISPVLVTNLVSLAPYLVQFILFHLCEVLFILTLPSLFLARLWEPSVLVLIHLPTCILRRQNKHLPCSACESTPFSPWVFFTQGERIRNSVS
jgi:hypothetical protein